MSFLEIWLKEDPISFKLCEHWEWVYAKEEAGLSVKLLIIVEGLHEINDFGFFPPGMEDAIEGQMTIFRNLLKIKKVAIQCQL